MDAAKKISSRAPETGPNESPLAQRFFRSYEESKALERRLVADVRSRLGLTVEEQVTFHPEHAEAVVSYVGSGSYSPPGPEARDRFFQLGFRHLVFITPAGYLTYESPLPEGPDLP